ncbi:Serine-protein kinase ATM, partial [Schistosoma japonicum]
VKVSRSSLFIMDECEIRRLVDYLATCTKRERKSIVLRLLNMLQVASNRQIINTCSDRKHQNSNLRVVSWDFFIESVIHVVMSELQSHSVRGNRNESRFSLELTPYFKILQIIALHGSKGNFPINLNTFVLCFLQTVRDKDVLSVHQEFFNTLCLFFLEARSNTIVLEVKNRDDLIFWCCDQLISSTSLLTGRLICLLIRQYIGSSALPFHHILNTMFKFLKSCNSVTNQSKSTFAANLGWVCHLLRWLLCNVYIDLSDWQEIALIIDQTIPDFLKLVFDRHQINCTFSTNLDITDKSKEMDPSHPYNALQFYSDAWTKESTWDSLSLASSFTTLSSSQHRKYFNAVEGNAVKTTDQTKFYYPASVHLAYPPHFFLTEQLPKLCSDSSSLNVVKENTDLDIHQEIVCLWRWMFIFCHYKQSFRQLTEYGENCSGSSVLLKYLLQEFKSVTSRLSFQSEDTCWKTIIGLRNFFSLLAAVLMVEYGKNASDHNNKSEIFSELLREQVKYDTSEYQRERKKARSEVDSNPETFVSSAFLLGTLVNLANNDTKFGCLWWLAIDWIIRFMWQNTFIMRSKGNKYELLNEIETLLVIVSGSIKVKQIPLANECLVTMIHTLVVVLNYEIRQGFTSYVPSNSALSAYNEIWEFSACLFEQCSIQRNRLQGHKREGSLSGYRFLNHDRLVCNLLSALFCLHNSVGNNHFNCPNISNICLRIFTSLMKCLDLDTGHLNNSPWRIRLIVLSSTYLKLPQGLIPCDIFNVSTIPNILLFNLGIIFLLYNYVKIWNADDYHIENDATTILPTEMNILLTGILWAYKSYIVAEFIPTIHSSNPWFYTESSLIQPLFSNQDHIEAIEFIRKVILIHTRLNEKLPVTSENIPSLVLLLTTELSLIHYKYCILNKECKFLDELPNVYVVLLKMVLEQILANLISTCYKCYDSTENNLFTFSLQLSTDNFCQKYKKLEIFVKSLEALLELLAYGVDDISWITPLQLGQLLNVSTTPVSYSAVGQSISENTSQPMAVSTQLMKTNFGDEDFGDSTFSVVVPVDITDSQSNSGETYLHNKLYQSVKLRIFNSLFLFGFRRKNISLLKQLYQSLQESISKIVLNDKESAKWLYKLTKNTSQSMYRIFSDKNYDCRLSSDFAELITYLISSVVDTIREMLKSLLARFSQYLCIITVVKLVRSLCMLSNSMVFIYRKLHQQSNSNLDGIGHWKLICQHMDQLIRTVWSVGSKFSRKSLQGFEVATIDCLKFWINLYSAKFIDIQNNPEYCLVLTVQHITPVATFQLAKFLQTLIAESYSFSWCRINHYTILRFCQTLLELLSSTKFQFISLKTEADTTYQPVNLNYTVYIHSLILKLLTVLSTCTTDIINEDSCFPSLSNEIPTLLYSDLECLTRCCTQMTIIYNKEEANSRYHIYKLFIEILAGNDETYFHQSIRPILLSLVLKRWLNNFSFDGFKLVKFLSIFPWQCWGISNFQDAQKEIGPVLGKLALTDFYEPTMKVHDILIMTSPFTSHIPELVGAILIQSIMQNTDNNSKLPQWNIITELCGGSKLTRATLLNTSNVCKLIHCLLESCILYNMPIKSNATSEFLPSHHYVGSILIKCLAKLYINLNFEQFVSTTQLGDTKQYHLKYAYDLMGLCPMNSDLVNRLYQVGVQFLCSQPPVNALHHSIPYCLRLTCWCAISNVIISILFNTVSLDENKDNNIKLVQEFSVWLLVNGHLSLLGSELTRIEHLEELLDSLHYLFVQIRPFSIFQQNVQLLINIHHSTVYVLHNLAKHLLQSEKQIQSDYSNELKQLLLQKMSSILNLLVGENRCPIFNKAVYKLCELSEVKSPGSIDSPSSDIASTSCLEEYKRSFSCLSTYNEKNFQQLLKIVSNDSELFHIVYCPQLLFYPIKMFEEVSFDMSIMFDLMPANKSVLKSDVLIQQIKSVLMKSSTDVKHMHIGLMAASINKVDDGSIKEISSSNMVDLVIRLENILNPSKSDKWFLKLLVFSDFIAKRSALHCFSILQQVLSFRNLSNFDPIDPASMGFNHGVSVNDDFLDPMFYIKRQILSYLVSAACIPNSLATLNSSKVLYELFSRCPSMVMSLLPQFSENHLPTTLHTILAPYIQCIDISSRSTSTRNKITLSLIQKLDPKQKAQILDSLPMLTSKLQVFLENSLTMSNNNIKLHSWLVDFVILFLESGLIQDDLFSCIKPFLQFSFNYTLCNGIITCLSHNANSSNSELHRFQNILLESLVAFNCFIQWIKRSRENITLNPSITINWLCAANRATVLKRPHEARLFLELAWLSDNCPNEWITTDETIHRTWVNLCRLTGDLMGLIASQTSFLLLNNSENVLKEKSSHFNVLPLVDKTKLVVHELLGNWSYLLNCYDKCYLNEEPNSSPDNSVHPKLALCLQRLGANRLFNKFSYSNNESIDLTVNKQSDITLKELRSAAAWRLSRWDNKSNDIPHLDRLICPPTDWKMCGLETSFYWLLRAASQSNWFRVSEIVASQSELLIEELYSDTVQFISSDQLILCGQKIGFLDTLKQLGYHLLHANQEQCLQLTLTLLCHALNSMNFSSATYLTHDQLNFQSTLDSIEPFLTLSTSFIDVVLSKNIFPNHVQCQLRSFLIHTYLYFAETATTSTNLSDFHLVQNWLENAINCQKFMLNSNEHFATSLDYNWQNLKCIKLKSHLERQQGDFDLSISRLQSGLKTVNAVIEQTDKSSEYLGGYINCYIHGMTVLCNWLHESRTKSAADLLLNYINPAINLAQRLKLNPDANAFMHVAKFSDAQFTTLDSYLTSSEFATRQHFLTQAQKDVIVLSDLGEKSRLLRLLQRQSALEIDELTALTTDADHFLETAIDAYAQCLALSDDHNLLLIERMVDWHPHHSAFTLLFLVNAELDNDYVPNYQSAQPSSRQHPTRVNSSKASTDTGSSKSSTELSFRIQAAQQLYKRLSLGRRKELLYQMQYLTEAYVDWANVDVSKYKANSGNISLPNGCKLYGLISPSLHCSSYRTMDRSLELVALPTCTFRIDRSGTYPTSNLIHVAGFSPDFQLVGGINLPKVIGCLGTDGKLYRQLVKGKDDPRQDAVMQQVFTAANCLLAKYGKLNKVDLPQFSTSLVNSPKYRANWLDMDKGLCIRTYKVIPMAQRSGVIEWCEDTVPLGDWLASERTGAHQRYKPHDMPPIQAKQRLAVVKDRTPDRKLIVFNEICEKLKPVLAYFFLEQFPSPKSWFISRMAYIRSIAVTSIVGYLVGLGDRHPHNLLLHKSTGEIVHIDLGVAFDQGRLLPTPEMVPFRLTRDIVHALGPLGLQTGFIPASETVLRELRKGSDVILTLLQVLLYDPLYSWSLTPAQLCALEAKRAETNTTLDKSKSNLFCDDQSITNKSKSANRKENFGVNILRLTENSLIFPCNQHQLHDTEPVNQLAERVLLGVKSKLQGLVSGNLGVSSNETSSSCSSGGLDQLDVSGHVSLLVRAATDYSNLSRMYFGWQAYL